MPVATQSDFLRDLYESWSKRMVANPRMLIADLRSMFDEWHQATLEPEGVAYKSDVLAGVPAVWAMPLKADAGKVVLYAHGGGFAVGSSASHRKLAGHLAKQLAVHAVVIDYRRAPEYPFPAQIDDMTAVYRELLSRGFTASNLLTAGDSAGGNLAISTVLKLQQDGQELPGAVVALSPWLDMENAGQTLRTNLATDTLITAPLLAGMIAGYLGERTGATEPLANPLYADYTGFPRLYVTAGSVECLVDNATRVVGRAKAAGVDATLSVVDGQQHVFVFSAGRSSAADLEIDRIAKWYRA